MTERLILERESARVVLPEGTGEKIKLRIIGWDEGSTRVDGSSGIYPVEMLKRDVPEAFPKGTRMRANHDGICDGGGDVRRLMAKTVDTPWAEADGMYTNARVAEAHSPFLREFADVIGVSISAAGELATVEDEDGNITTRIDEETGKPIVARLYSMEESPYNAIDFVEAPGADGRIVGLAVESAKGKLAEMNVREAATFALGTVKPKEDSPALQPVIKEGTEMDEETLNAILARHQESLLSAVNTRISEALTPAPAPEATVSDVAEAIIAADLSAEGRAAVYERIALGQSATDAIAKESTREAAISAAITEKLERTYTLENTGYTTGSTVTEAHKAAESEFDALVVI